MESHVEKGKAGRFLFFPIPGEQGISGLSYLRRLAERVPDRVLVFPFRFREAFLSVLQGARFGLMPSFYEPFGMANEFYLHGTMGIARATGGLVEQIVPIRTGASFTESVRLRADRFHGPGEPATGFLYREKDDPTEEGESWRALHRGEERKQIPLFREMSDALVAALSDATEWVREHPEEYDRTVVRGIDFLRRRFNWDRTAEKVLRAVDRI